MRIANMFSIPNLFHAGIKCKFRDDRESSNHCPENSVINLKYKPTIKIVKARNKWSN